jgi:hypothetical protein
MAEGYEAARSGLAAMMAGGMPGGMGEEGEGGEMAPCPLCMGTGMVPEDLAEGMGGAMPSSLAMRMPPQLSQMPMPAGQMSGPMQMGM